MKREESFITNLTKLYVLFILSKGPAHGYDIMKEFKAATGKVLSPGQIYPLLSAMQRKGFVEMATKVEGKRQRKIYALNDKGKEFAGNLRAKIVRVLGL
ncbi:MAG: PadR family transcriptional regulator [Nanoarchaeota archaeon]|nr:PadR family transcriptional regulator [Nanoarchaeota archaeon]MBU4299643.1 PadR family transcriptional regulator [Nanoarchaeota archaeon]MBU4452439.1 PadR family transcriptional regulator [Nanoarchaeota archaeon]MCG2723900.1 PadR family transcriptional regulator [archaeon]